MSGSIEYLNESGCFTVDKDGLLIGFTADNRNEVRHARFLPTQCDRAVIDLHIPEGVRFIGRKYGQRHVGDEDFSNMLILGEVTFRARCWPSEIKPSAGTSFQRSRFRLR